MNIQGKSVFRAAGMNLGKNLPDVRGKLIGFTPIRYPSASKIPMHTQNRGDGRFRGHSESSGHHLYGVADFFSRVRGLHRCVRMGIRLEVKAVGVREGFGGGLVVRVEAVGAAKGAPPVLWDFETAVLAKGEVVAGRKDAVVEMTETAHRRMFRFWSAIWVCCTGAQTHTHGKQVSYSFLSSQKREDIPIDTLKSDWRLGRSKTLLGPVALSSADKTTSCSQYHWFSQ